MFQTRLRPPTERTILSTLELVFHATVHNIRKTHRNALAGLVLNIFQSAILIATFYLMFSLLGVRGAAIRGDFMLFLMSGIFLFMVHAKAISAVARADGPTSSMLQHAPLTTFVTIGAAALSSLYLQLLSMFVILFLYHVLWNPITIEYPVAAFGMLLLAWGSGVGVGIVFFAIRPWAPDVVGVLTTVYSRLNMVASGKMFVANTLPGYMLALFDWNPLFHTIDQARGDVFINYNPHFSSATYPLWVTLGLLMVGLLIESYTRRHASVSWSAGR